ncbi:aminotransferase class V-fold PLP-dependent enzyme [Epibacterium sp. SM1979]|uniref:Aminotransferase class V-fold PLP-dependent enzyme n=1 Tax=Tritonibacter litoralis TaxID=2662264 RepID=A0A843YD93_9RHOB|nr:aminotransferase class V-fold PLP-dependent enzyme [Tritonibacter litoralis]MQQ07293.1 aminotransferase class V-fold PLP-dependent enzyme [Tritonibacter litoralis]
MADLDLNFVRSQFPAFAEPSLAGQAFFENAGGSYTCAPVINRLTRFYHQRKVQPYGPYEASRIAGDEMDAARSGLAAWLGVEVDELSFGPSTTQNTYVLAQAFRQFLSPGEAIVVTDQDHEANSGPWRRLAEDGIDIREWKMNPETGELKLEALEALLDEDVRLVCFPHCSNVVGQVNPVSDITAIAHAAGAFVCVDGVSYAPHGLPNVETLGPDIYLFSAYKTYGPHQGIMVVRRALADLLPNQGHFFNGDVRYKRFTPAGPDHAQVAACTGMVEYFESLAAHHGAGALDQGQRAGLVHDLMRAHEVALMRPVLDWIKAKNNLRLLGPVDPVERAPTLALALEDPPTDIAAALADCGIMAGASDFYAVRALRALGIDPDRGVLRISFTHYTSPDEINHLLNALEDVL